MYILLVVGIELSLHDDDDGETQNSYQHREFEETGARSLARLVKNQIIMLALLDVKIAFALFELRVFVIDNILFEVLFLALFLVNLVELSLYFVLPEVVGVF